MYAASAAEDFERAARLRDDLGRASTGRWRSRQVVLGDGTDADVVALAEDPLEVAVQIFYVRGGRVRGQRGWVADRVEEGGTSELVEDFLLQLYAGAEPDSIPREILVPALPPDVGDLRAAARRPAGEPGADPGAPARGQEGAPGDRRPQRPAVPGPAQDQASQRPDHPQPGTGGDPAGAGSRRRAPAHRVLRRVQPPGHRGRGLDGRLRGRPGPQERVPPVRDQGRRRPERRRLHARGDHPAVPAAARRAGRVAASRSATDDAARCSSTPRPVGRGSSPTPPDWSSSTAVRLRWRLPSGRSTSSASTTSRSAGWPSGWRRSGCRARRTRSSCARSSEGLYLLQRVRDEAHRFAITHHRSRRSKSMVESLLDDVPGLGEVRRKTLLKHFGSLKKLREAERRDRPGAGHRPSAAAAIKEAVAQLGRRLSPSTPPPARSRS